MLAPLVVQSLKSIGWTDFHLNNLHFRLNISIRYTLMTPTIKTERLILRPITREDTENVQRYFGVWGVIKHLSVQVPWPYPDDGAQQFLDTVLEKFEMGNEIGWAICEINRPEYLIGFIHYTADASHGGNRGFWLGEPYQGKGYMTEAVIHMQDYLFFDLKIPSISVMNSIDNTQSHRIKEKTGATLIGETNFEHRNGVNRSFLWEITRENWAKFRKRTLI